jgi:hypothetical protein
MKLSLPQLLLVAGLNLLVANLQAKTLNVLLLVKD